MYVGLEQQACFIVEVEDIMWPCVFSQTDLVFPEETVGCLAHIYLLVKTGYRVTQKCIFLGPFGVCAYSDTVWFCPI